MLGGGYEVRMSAGWWLGGGYEVCMSAGCCQNMPGCMRCVFGILVLIGLLITWAPDRPGQRVCGWAHNSDWARAGLGVRRLTMSDFKCIIIFDVNNVVYS